jgi:hypothetical protein
MIAIDNDYQDMESGGLVAIVFSKSGIFQQRRFYRRMGTLRVFDMRKELYVYADR